VRAWASVESTVTITGTANAPVLAMVALRRKSRRPVAPRPSPGPASPLWVPIGRGLYRDAAVGGTPR
jgi:hypothetical protein